MKSQNLDINVDKENYLQALTLNLPRVEEAEEFELCQRAVKWISHLNSEEV